VGFYLAKRPLAQRGYIGHEKAADEAWLRENNIHAAGERTEGEARTLLDMTEGKRRESSLSQPRA